MAEYIDREAAIAAVKDALNPSIPRFVRTKIALDSVPSADVAPVRHGRWEEDCAGAAVCSVCGEYAFETNTHHLCGWFPNFCPNCGAKMDGGDPDER